MSGSRHYPIHYVRDNEDDRHIKKKNPFLSLLYRIAIVSHFIKKSQSKKYLNIENNDVIPIPYLGKRLKFYRL